MQVFGSVHAKLYNPLPKITWRDIYKKAKVRPGRHMRNNLNRNAFEVDVVYGGGADCQLVCLQPGEEVSGVNERQAREVLSRKMEERGIVLILETDTPQMVRDKEIAALNKAIDHLEYLGSEQIQRIAQSLGHNDQAIQENRSIYYADYFAAQARADVLKKHLERLEQEEVEDAPAPGGPPKMKKAERSAHTAAG